MSLPPRVLCRTGCGDFGDPELEFLCVDCHGDKIEIDKQRALLEYIQSKQQNNEASLSTGPESATTSGPESPSRRRGPLTVDHRKAFDVFMSRHREKDPMVVVRECLFLEREFAIRETSKTQLRRYMVATDLDEPVDPKEWGRYQYGAPRDVPKNDVDQATERAAQIKLFCNWRRRTVARSIASRRQVNEEQRKTTAQAEKNRKKNERKQSAMKLMPRISKPSLSLRSLGRSGSKAKVLSATVDNVVEGDKLQMNES